MAGYVRVQYKLQWMKPARGYSVVIDGHNLGSLPSGAAKTFEISPGSHWAKLQSWLQSSNGVTFTVDDGQTVDLFCEMEWPRPRLSQA